MREEYNFSKLKICFKHIYANLKIPSLKIYQNYARIYLDEYENQDILRHNYFNVKKAKEFEIAKLFGEPFMPTKPIVSCLDMLDNCDYYQRSKRVYLDEYEGQEELRKEYFAQRWQIQSNPYIKKVA